METEAVDTKMSTSVFSWIGFGMAVALILLIWFVNILVFNGDGDLAAIYMVTIMLGAILGLLAMIFSIIGLVMAIRNGTAKWMGVSGIVLCVLSLFSFFVPLMCAGMIKSQTMEIKLPEHYLEENVETVDDVTIQVFDLGRVRCINNVDAENSVIGNMRSRDRDFKKLFADWLEKNNVDSSTSFCIETSKDASYSDVSVVFEALQENGITRFRLSGTLTDADYY